MQILRTKGIKSHGWGGYLNCRAQPSCLPTLVFRYMPRTSIKDFRYLVGYPLYVPDRNSDMPIGMSADTCIQYWIDL